MRWLMCCLMKVIKRCRSIFKKTIWKVAYLSGVKFGRGTVFYPGCHITVEYHGKVIIGKNCFFNHSCSLTCLNYIEIGNDCIFGENVKFYDHNHGIDNNILFRKQEYVVDKIKIGNNCWVGSDVIILSGVTIGNNVVIGAGSVITKDIPNNVVVLQKKETKILPIKAEENYGCNV